MKMKNYLPRLIIISIWTFSQCTNPEKTAKNVEAPDSITPVADSDSTAIATPQDTIVIDSVESSTMIFNKADSQGYYILSNYFTSVTENKTKDIQVIDSTCAVLVYPTAEQLSSLQKEEAENFATIVDDNSYYHGIAIEMLDSINIETINAEKRYLTFHAAKSKTWTLDIRREGAPPWNLIFFSTSKEPQIVPIADLSHQRIIDYFGVNSSEK